MSTRPEVIWAAGLWEGEGHISLRAGASGVKQYVQMILQMTDEDVVRRFHAVLGFGQVTLRPSRNPAHKPLWRWNGYGLGNAQALQRSFAPWLGERRTAQFEVAIQGASNLRWPVIERA